MGKKGDKQQLSYDDRFDLDDQDDDDEHLMEFQNLLIEELLCNVKDIPFDHIINTILTDDGVTFHGTIHSHNLNWLYTADRLNIYGKTIYSFRFASACHPDYYKSFITKYHPHFASTNQTRHSLEGWCYYIGQQLPREITNYLNIAKVMNAQKSSGPMIFVNNTYERLDIEFDLRSNHSFERITITFEPGYPVV
jgi:hypothetical protein